MIYTPILLNSGETRVVKNPCKPIPLVQPNLSTNPSLSIDFVNHFGRRQIHYGKPIPFQLDIGWRGVWPINLTGQSLSLSLSSYGNPCLYVGWSWLWLWEANPQHQQGWVSVGSQHPFPCCLAACCCCQLAKPKKPTGSDW